MSQKSYIGLVHVTKRFQFLIGRYHDLMVWCYVNDAMVRPIRNAL